MKQFNAGQYAIDQGWDYESIELTAQNGVSVEDRANIEEILGEDAVDEAEAALLTYCRARVAEARTSYHISRLGSLASPDLRPDIDGYVHLTREAVLDGRWDALAEMSDEEADEIAAGNVAATDASNRAIRDWQERRCKGGYGFEWA